MQELQWIPYMMSCSDASDYTCKSTCSTRQSYAAPSARGPTWHSKKHSIPCDWREESTYIRMRYHEYALSSRYDGIHIWCCYVDMTYSHRSTVHASLECSNDSEKEERRTIEKVCFNELKDYGILNLITRTQKLSCLMMTFRTSSPLNFVSCDLWLFAWSADPTLGRFPTPSIPQSFDSARKSE